MPLPPYIKNYEGSSKERYQTVYAKKLGSAAAPTAGLHFYGRTYREHLAKGHRNSHRRINDWNRYVPANNSKRLRRSRHAFRILQRS